MKREEDHNKVVKLISKEEAESKGYIHFLKILKNHPELSGTYVKCDNSYIYYKNDRYILYDYMKGSLEMSLDEAMKEFPQLFI